MQPHEKVFHGSLHFYDEMKTGDSRCEAAIPPPPSMEDGAAAHLFIKVRLPFSGEIRGSGVGELGAATDLSMFPESRPKLKTLLGAGGVMVAFGLFLVLSAGDRTAVAFALFGFTMGFVLLGFGVALMVAVVARFRRD